MCDFGQLIGMSATKKIDFIRFHGIYLWYWIFLERRFLYLKYPPVRDTDHFHSSQTLKLSGFPTSGMEMQSTQLPVPSSSHIIYTQSKFQNTVHCTDRYHQFLFTGLTNTDFKFRLHCNNGRH